jgi:hypothetical protein
MNCNHKNLQNKLAKPHNNHKFPINNSRPDNNNNNIKEPTNTQLTMADSLFAFVTSNCCVGIRGIALRGPSSKLGRKAWVLASTPENSESSAPIYGNFSLFIWAPKFRSSAPCSTTTQPAPRSCFQYLPPLPFSQQVFAAASSKHPTNHQPWAATCVKCGNRCGCSGGV